MNNNLNQSPCLVAAYAQGTCNGGQFTVNPLAPDTHYTGPDVAMANPCQCSTVVYSLMSACAVCQNRNIETWSTWDVNCSQVYLMQFPNQVPSATSIPAWAYLDVVTNDTFSAAVAQADVCELYSYPRGTSTFIHLQRHQRHPHPPLMPLNPPAPCSTLQPPRPLYLVA
ncbi:hypothetical protein PILCRDRAFT_317299 [Piloderma croceum F 1598]|uniref:Uncharacterized protein n=1 Tax=Piloderma croceum (strain F 1598) TaxID=765440 RepID=A0A0C3FS33_PILCF|nr:hypothetical protein PILCRDRAFT_317299 [Piloderma croceum F 1598]